MSNESLEQVVPYKLGQMDARIGNIETTVAQIQLDVKALLSRDAQQKGSKATVAAWGGGGVTVGGLLVAVAQWLGIGPGPAAAAPVSAPVIVQPTPQQSVPAPADQRVNPTVQF